MDPQLVKPSDHHAIRPVPSVKIAREAIARAIALKSFRIGSVSMAGKDPILDAKISGPKPYADFITGVESDVYCVDFKIGEPFLGLGGRLDTHVIVRAVDDKISVIVASAKSINLAGCLPDYTPFPEVESYNAIRAQRTNIFGL